eukprot:TRINITY_DN1372_c0_g1_i1.p1 TRINITY_DN1372_c0_g1~~TRINITY_DN1372_c0_g1_i1.p1  ORF type:complete len:1582 (+),score=525.83 TRINITY_DN1372_c0_g1_i1:149-4894(+)
MADGVAEQPNGATGHAAGEEWDEVMENELARVRIHENERVPCRNFEYPVVRWTEAEMKSHVPEVLLSDDPLRMTGTPVGIERPTVSQVKKKVVPNPQPSEKELDLSFLDKDVRAEDDSKWADIRRQFLDYMQTGSEQTSAVESAIAEMQEEMEGAFEVLRAPVQRDSDDEAEADAPAPASLCEPEPEGDLEVLNLSDFSDEEDRELAAEEGFLDELREEISQQHAELKKVQEVMRVKAQEQADEEYERRVAIPEKKLKEIRATIESPAVKAEYAEIAASIKQRDEEFTTQIEAREQAAEEEVQKAVEELRQVQEAVQQVQQREHEAREREDCEERAKAEARLAALAKENRKRLLADRKRFRALKEQGELLMMESADIETRHAAKVLAEKRSREEAIARAKRIAREAQLSLQHDEEQEAVMNAETASRSALVSDADGALAVIAPRITELTDFITAMAAEVAAVSNEEKAERSGTADAEAAAREALCSWIGTTREAWASAAEALVEEERGVRKELCASETAARADIGRAAEDNQKKARAADLEIALAKQRRETYAKYAEDTEDGAKKLSAMILQARPSQRPPGAPATGGARYAGLKAQAQQREQWLGFFDSQCLSRLQKQRVPVDVLPEGIEPAEVDPLAQSMASMASMASADAPAQLDLDVLPPEEVLDVGYIRKHHTPVEQAASLRFLTVSFEQLKAVRGPIAPYSYLTELALPNNAIAYVDGSFPATLQHLDLTDNAMAGNLAFLAGFPGLTTLKLDSNRLHSLSGIERCPHLKDVSVRHNCISVLGPLKACQCVTRLDVFGNNLSSLDMPDVSSLTYLNAGRNALTDVSNVFRSCPLLLEVHLYNNRLSALPSRIHSTLLQTLLLSDNQIEKVTDLSSLPLLTVLDLSSNRVNDIHGVHGCLHLEVLDLAFNNMKEPRLVEDACRNLLRLRRLNVNDNPLCAAPAAAAAASADALKQRFAALLPALHEFNTEVVERVDDEWGVPLSVRGAIPTAAAAAVARKCILGGMAYRTVLEDCALPAGRGGAAATGRNWAHDTSYDEVCGAHVAERRAFDARTAREVTAAKGQGSAAGALTLAHLHDVEDMALHQVGVHATPGSVHIRHLWRQDAGYLKQQQQSKEHRAAAKIGAWVRGLWTVRKHTAAAVRIQALIRGALVRHRLTGSKWVDPDEEDYGAVTLDFEPEVDTSEMQKFGEIFKVFSQAQAAAQHARPAPAAAAAAAPAPAPTAPPSQPAQQVQPAQPAQPVPTDTNVLSGLLNPSRPAGGRTWHHQLQAAQTQQAKTPTPPLEASSGGYRAASNAIATPERDGRRDSDAAVSVGLTAVFGRPPQHTPPQAASPRGYEAPRPVASSSGAPSSSAGSPAVGLSTSRDLAIGGTRPAAKARQPVGPKTGKPKKPGGKRKPHLPYASYGTEGSEGGRTPRDGYGAARETSEDKAWKDRNGVSAAGADEEDTPLSGVSLAWSSGMQRRDKKFDLIRKRRRAQERVLGVDREHTLEGKVDEINRFIHQQQQQQPPVPARKKQHPQPPRPGVEQDVEVQSMTSTLVSQETNSRKDSFAKNPLPPLTRSLNSSEGARVMKGLR